MEGPKLDPDFRLSSPKRSLRVGLLGCGVVGTAVAEALLTKGERLEKAAGVRLELARIAVLHLDKPRSAVIPRTLLHGDAWQVVRDPSIDIVVEAIGGTDPALSLLTTALWNSKDVVTANKELISRHGRALTLAAARWKRSCLYEASVCGAVPVVRAIRESLSGNSIASVTGVLNGTTNYVLSQSASGGSLDDILRDARRLGYAEPDPSFDLSGRDAAFKLAILIDLAFGESIDPDDIPRDSIEIDTDLRSRPGHVLKQVARAKRGPSGIDCAVSLEQLPVDHPLARLQGPDNGVLVETDDHSELLFSGPGAGGSATAAAVLGDLVTVARATPPLGPPITTSRLTAGIPAAKLPAPLAAGGAR